MNFNFPSMGGTRKRVTSNSSISLTTPPSIPVTTPSPSPPSDNWEAVDLSSTEYARMRRELMQLISDLRSLGAETFIDLPSIVVIGGQSAGKSSLVEAVSGVNVPRDSGTCTRCPMECTMSSNATSWSCKVKLRFDYDSFGRFAVHQKEIDFGPIITDKNDMDVWLRRAQAAILNPDLIPESFHRKSIEDLKNLTVTNSLKFSRNVVSIFIEDPDATDLSFVDLPGLIQNDDQEVLDLVRELTESYISRPNTIILTTIPMSDDMQNQQSVKLAREADPYGERTIGILTKPDTLGDGAVHARKFWLDVIEGYQHPLKHGYYCVRLPDDNQRAQRLSRSAFQRIAAEYFDTASPWSEVADRGRFGIPAFVTDISVLLVSHIKKVIPELREDVEQLLASCLEEISTLPKPLDVDPQIEVLVRVNAFCDAFKGVVLGASSDKSLAQRNRALYTLFAHNIRGTSPDFRPFEQPTLYSRIVLDSEEPWSAPGTSLNSLFGVQSAEPSWGSWNSLPEPNELQCTPELCMNPAPAPCVDPTPPSPVDDSEFEVRPTPKGKRGPVKGKKAQGKGISAPVKSTSVPRPSSSAPVKSNNAPPKSTSNKPRVMGLYDVRKTILESIAWELPGNIPYEAKTRLINQFTALWSTPAEKCLISINDVLDDVIEQLVKTHFGRFKVLEKLIADFIRHDIEEHKRKALVAIKETLALEITPIYTQNLKDFQDLREKWLAKYRLARRDPEAYKLPRPPTSTVGVSRPNDYSTQQALEYLSQAGYKGLTVEDLTRLSPRDQFEDELIIMADVRAYFTIAYKRITDHVPLKIEQSLHQALAERLSVNLLQRLINDTTSTGSFADRMKELVSEDPATEQRRTRLEGNRVRLYEMRRKLVSFAA